LSFWKTISSLPCGCALAVSAGSIRDPRQKIGLASLTAGMLDQGTSDRSESQIADAVDSLGATLGASAESDYLVVSANGLSAYKDTLFDLMADVTLRPVFPAGRTRPAPHPNAERHPGRARRTGRARHGRSRPQRLRRASVRKLFPGHTGNASSDHPRRSGPLP
jgi:hypothetical protein